MEIVILGYYSCGPHEEEIYDSWDRRLPVPIIGKIVFCGVLLEDYGKKVEIALDLVGEDYFASAICYEVEEYEQEMTYIIRDFVEDYPLVEEFFLFREEKEIITIIPDVLENEFSCSFFTVSDLNWTAHGGQPFTLSDTKFVDVYSVEENRQEQQEHWESLYGSGLLDMDEPESIFLD